MYCLPVAIPLRGWLLGVSVITGPANVAPCRVLFQFHIPSQLVLPPLTYDHVSCKYRQKKHQCHRPSGSLLALPDCVQSLQHPVRHYMQLFQLPCSFYYGNFFLTEEGRSIIPQKVPVQRDHLQWAYTALANAERRFTKCIFKFLSCNLSTRRK